MGIRTLASSNISTSSLTSIYSSPTGFTTTIANAVLCNGSSSAVDVDVYVSTGSSDVLVTKARISGGVGKSLVIKELIGGLNAGGIIKIQPSAATLIYYAIYGEQVAA